VANLFWGGLDSLHSVKHEPYNWLLGVACQRDRATWQKWPHWGHILGKRHTKQTIQIQIAKMVLG